MELGAYLRWALIRGWALIRINTVFSNCELKMNVDDTHLAYANSDVKSANSIESCPRDLLNVHT